MADVVMVALRTAARLALGSGLAAAGASCGGIGGIYLIGEVIHWTKPGFDQRQLDVDWSQCRRENTAADNSINPQNTKACMRALGYSYTEAGI